MLPLRTSLAPLFTLGLAWPALAQSPYQVTILHVNTPGHPTNVVPGLGIPFRAGGTGTSAFERPYISSNGLHLAINVVAAATTADDDVLLLNGAVLLREGSPAPWAPGQNVGTIDAELAINDAGDILLGNNVAPATTLDDYIALYSGGVWTVLAQEGQPTPVGGTWGSTIDSCALSNTGTACYRGTTIVGLPTASNAVVVLGGGQLQKGVDVPLLQAGGGTATWENFTINRVLISPDGSTFVVVGDTNAATSVDAVLTVNNVVLIQEGFPLPGSSFVNAVSAIGNAWIDGAGNWYARGSNQTTGDDWMVRNGVLVAESSGTDEIVPGSGEHWDDATFATCFFAFDGNALGQFLICGVTDAPAVANGVIVFDDGFGGRYVVVRENDPVDLDGNGLFDDDRFFNTFGDDDVRLLDDGSIVFTATLRNGAGTAVDQGLFKLLPTAASCTFRNGSGINPVALSCVTLPVVGSTWLIGLTGGPNTLATFLYADPTPIPAFPLFGGELLIAPTAFAIPTSIALPYSFQGLQFALQGLRLDFDGIDLSFVLTNAQDTVLGY
ncbi:MAG: hypothetical protein KF830_07460 [Planctomycetes bacterium]|nr:hypothetical protein [Planctomycetota bacterium]